MDTLILFEMISLFYLTNTNKNQSTFDLLIILTACLLSGYILVKSISNMRISKHQTLKLWIFIYIISMIIHSILLHYEVNIITNLKYHTSQTNNHYKTSHNVTINIDIISYSLQIKTIILTLIFIAMFAYRLYHKLIPSSISVNSINHKRIYFCILTMLFSILLFFIVDLYLNHGNGIHSIGILFGLLYAKIHLCCNTDLHSHSDIDTQHLTQTYDAGAKGTCDGSFLECCYPAGCGIDCKSGCCECNSSHPANACVCCGDCFDKWCGWDCCGEGRNPDSICFSCCGLCTCYCGDPGGCMDCQCCSFDCCTWCCC